MECIGAVPKITGQRFFHDHESVLFQSSDGDCLVDGGRSANMDDIGTGDQLIQLVEGLHASLLSKGFSLFFRKGVNARNLDIHGRDLFHGLPVKGGSKT